MSLSRDAKWLLAAYTLYAFGSPMVNTFSGTYVWRLFHSPTAVGTFVMLFCLGLPIGFLLNGILLRHIPLPRLFLLSCLAQGIVPFLLVLLPAPSLGLVWIIGAILGIASGLYWANRNYLTSRVTVNGFRFRFISLESTCTTLAGIIAPLLIGWTITLGEQRGFFSVQTGYQITTLIGFFLLGICGHLVSSITIPSPNVSRLRIHHGSDLWQQWRWLELVNGAVDGAGRIFPLFIILFFLGQEESVGTVQSISALLSAFMIYMAGKRVTAEKDHVRLLFFWAAMSIGGAIIFTSLYSPQGAIIFLAIHALVLSFRWGSFASIMYDLVEQEEKNHVGDNRYALLMDREAFLNFGRAFALAAFVIAYTFFPDPTMRFGLLAAGALKILLVTLTAHIEKQMQNQNPA